MDQIKATWASIANICKVPSRHSLQLIFQFCDKLQYLARSSDIERFFRAMAIWDWDYGSSHEHSHLVWECENQRWGECDLFILEKRLFPMGIPLLPVIFTFHCWLILQSIVQNKTISPSFVWMLQKVKIRKPQHSVRLSFAYFKLKCIAESCPRQNNLPVVPQSTEVYVRKYSISNSIAR